MSIVYFEDEKYAKKLGYPKGRAELSINELRLEPFGALIEHDNYADHPDQWVVVPWHRISHIDWEEPGTARSGKAQFV